MNNSTEIQIIRKCIKAIEKHSDSMDDQSWLMAKRTMLHLERRIQEIRTGESAGFW